MAASVAGAKILLVDDDADVRRVFATLLRGRHEVDEVESGAAAVDRVQSEHYELVILDLHMPGVDGFAVIDAIEQSDENRAVPIIVVSAVGTDDVRSRLLKNDRVTFVSKPVPIRVLSSLVDEKIAGAGR
jgi:CheY-like chemotaxis protein